jgi:hypothetical protein
MVRACRPPAREPVRSWLGRRSTMATSTPANANSPANISPVGPPPAITTACSVIVTLRSASRRSRPTHHNPRPPRSPAARTPAPARRVHATARHVRPPIRRPRATHASSIRHAFRDSHVRRFWPRSAILPHDPGLAASPQACYTFKVGRSGDAPPLSRPLRTDNFLAKRRRAAYSGTSAWRISRGLHAVLGTPIAMTEGVSNS